MLDPTPTRRQFLKLSAGAALAAGATGILAACASSSSASKGGTTTTSTTAPLRKLSAMEPFPLYLAFISDCGAKSLGYAPKQGIDLDLQFARSAPQALQQLTVGNVAVIRNSPLGVVPAVVKQNVPVVCIGMINQAVGYRLVSRPKKPYDSLDALKGKTVGMATLGGNAEDTLNFLLKGKGIDPTTVKRVAVGNEAAALAFVDQGKVDAVLATTESTGTMQAQGLDAHVHVFDDANPLLGTAFVTSQDTLAKRRADLVAFLRAIHQSATQLLDPKGLDDAIPKIRKDWQLPQLDDPAKAKPVINALSSVWVAAGPQNLLVNVPDRWAQGIAEFEKLKIIPAGTDPTRFYTNDLVHEATA